MKYWWINQSATYKTAIAAGFVWAPMLTKNGRRHPSVKFIRELSIGDIVFSNHLGGISAIGQVDGLPRAAKRPYDEVDSSDGWLVPVTFMELSTRIRPKDLLGELLPFVEQRPFPLSKIGNVLQIYLCPIPFGFAEVLIQYIGSEYGDVIKTLSNREVRNTYEIGDVSAFNNPTKINVSSATGIFPYLPQKGKFHIITGENGTGKTRYLEKLSADVLHGLSIGPKFYSSMICFAGTIYDKFPRPPKSDSEHAYLYFGNKTNNNMFSEISPFRQLYAHLFTPKRDYSQRSKLAGEVLESIGLEPTIELLQSAISNSESNQSAPVILRTKVSLDGRYSRDPFPQEFNLTNIVFEKNGSKVNLENLSSGERLYVLVVLGLCFCLSEDSLVLFDEPENSLHPKWQTKIIKDIHVITSKLSGTSTVVIATHSPLVVSSIPNVNALVRDLPSTEDWLSSDLYGKNSDSVLETQFGLFSPRSLAVTSAIQACLHSLVMSEFEPDAFKLAADRLATMEIELDTADPLYAAVKEITRIRSEMA